MTCVRKWSESRRARWRWVVLLLPLVACCAGCPFAPRSGDEAQEASSLSALDGNVTLDAATALMLGPDDALSFRGSLSGTSDIGLFELGRLAPGDRLIVDVRRISGDLDPVAAIFDSRDHLVAFNDDRAADGSNLNPLIDFVVPGDEDTYFLGIIAFPGSFTRGDYEATVRVQRGVGVPAPRGQIVYLNWAGGDDVRIENVGRFDLSPFSAADLGLPASQTEALKDRVQEIVPERYAGFVLLVLNSDDHAEPAAAHTTVYFGGDSDLAFAISEQIDSFNRDPGDDTLIFTASYRNSFRRTPTFEEMAQALGNTVAHEVGHLLGLVHTADCDSLMDTTCSNNRILAPQEFKTAPLDRSVFPFGYQPALDILEWVLGLAGF